ncbi:hypothetical protein D3C87_81540 [compost metagenome]
MLKAVRFDLEEHEELIKFIEDYRDKKNRPNHSEAIRMLMQKGLDTINKVSNPQPQFDIEAIKRDIVDQIKSQMNLSPVHERVFTPVNDNLSQSKIIKDEVNEVPMSSQPAAPSVQPLNPLLANLLGNSQR